MSIRMKMEENCGVFAYSGNKESFPVLVKGVFSLQHRGQKFCGVSTSDGERIFWRPALPGLVKENFKKEDMEKFKGCNGIMHVALKEPQPFLVEKSKLGKFAVAFSGRITNQEELEERYSIISSETFIQWSTSSFDFARLPS